MKNLIFILLLFMINTNLVAQKKSKFNTFDKNLKKYKPKWNINISYGNTIFIGDLNKSSSQNFLPNVALSLKFNKEFNKQNSLQFGVLAGKNSGENNPTTSIPNMNFNSQYTQIYIAFRRALSKPELKKPQLHFTSGVGYYYADAQISSKLLENTTKILDDVWSMVFPISLELSYYIQENWGVILSITEQIFTRDNIDLYIDNYNGMDHQLIVNLGFCIKLN